MANLYTIPRADLFLRKYGTTDALDYLGNVTKAELTANISEETLKSFGNTPGTLEKFITEQTQTLTLTCNSASRKDLLKYLGASEVTIPAGSATVDIAAGSVAGSLIDLGYTNVSDVVITGKVAGTDYSVNAAAGTVQLLTTFSSASSVAFDYAEQKGGALNKDLQGEDRVYEVVVYSSTLKAKLTMFKVKFNPTTVQLVGDKFAEFELKGELLLDTTKLAGSTWGQYAKYIEA